jgi:hypothetical protein
MAMVGQRPWRRTGCWDTVPCLPTGAPSQGEVASLGSPHRPRPPMVLFMQVEDAMLDIYDLVYDQAVRNPSSARWQELAAIQDTVSWGQGTGGQQSVSLTVAGEWALDGPRSVIPDKAVRRGVPGHRPLLRPLGQSSPLVLNRTGCPNCGLVGNKKAGPVFKNNGELPDKYRA